MIRIPITLEIAVGLYQQFATYDLSTVNANLCIETEDTISPILNGSCVVGFDGERRIFLVIGDGGNDDPQS